MGTFTENEKIIISMDLISRQDAIDAINKAFERVFTWDGTAVTCSGSRFMAR